MADNRTVSEQGLAHIRRGHEAFNSGDLSAIVELATPDVEWGSTGAFPGLDDEYLTPEAIERWSEIVRNEWEEFEVSIGEVLHDGDDLVVVEERLRGRGRASGAEVAMSVFAAYWLTEDGLIRKRAAFTEPGPALEAAGLAAQ